MNDYLIQLLSFTDLSTENLQILSTLLLTSGLLLTGWLINLIFAKYLSNLFAHALKKTNFRLNLYIEKFGLIKKISRLIAPLFFYHTIVFINSSSSNIIWMPEYIHLLQKGTLLYLIIICFMILLSLINIGENWSTPTKNQVSLRGFFQISKIFLYCVLVIILLSIVLEQSPVYFLTGLGAASAIIILVFKDTILGFTASIQVSAYDMIREGDWITIPKYNVDGDVLSVSINTVKVQNFDKTIVTIPTSALIAEGVQNWRGMTEAGGRRIKRSIYLNIDTIKFCDSALIEKLKKIRLIKQYIDSKEIEIGNHNQQLSLNEMCDFKEINGRTLTNIGLFRAYITAYLKQHPKIHQDYTFLIRQLEPTAYGLPLQIYVFVNDTNWGHYETIQADIFDHLLACLRLFELKPFQVLSTLK